MKAIAVPTITYFGYKPEPNADLRRSRMNWFWLMLGTGSVVAASVITSMILTVLAWEMPNRIVSAVATLLLAVSLPLFFLLAHCMDRIGDIDKVFRLEYCRRHGLKKEN